MALPAFSQTFNLKTQIYNEDNGLSRYANFIHKDSRGIIWVGTQFGLWRFDGQDFTHFDGNVGLPFREIMEIQEDSEGWFWLYKSCNSKGTNCERDLAFFHPITQEILTFEQRFGDKVSVQANQIGQVVKDSLNFYLTTNQSLMIWSSEEGIREKKLQGLDFDYAPQILVKISDSLFGALYDVNLKLNQASYLHYAIIDTSGIVRTFPDPILIPNNEFKSLLRLSHHEIEFEKVRIDAKEFSFDDDGKLLIESLPFEMPPGSKREHEILLSEKIFANDLGDIYHPKYNISVSTGTFSHLPFHKQQTGKYQPRSNVWVKTKKTDFDAWPFQNYDLAYRGYLYDVRTRTSWLADRPGVELSRFEPNYIRHISNPYSNRQLAAGIGIFSDSLAILGVQGKSFLYKQRKNQAPVFKILNRGGYMPTRIFIDDTRYFWLSYYQNLIKINKENLNVLAKYSNEDLKGLGNAVWFNDRLWIVGHENILKFDPITEQFSSFTKFNDFEKAKSETFKWLLKIDENHLWLLTGQSLYLCSKEEGIIDEYGIADFGETEQFYQISKAKDGGYWMSSNSGVFYVPAPQIPEGRPSEIKSNSLDAGDTGIKHFSVETGLPNNETLGAFEDDFGFLWMPTPHGLIQMQIETGLSKLYTKADGLSNSGFQNNTFAESPDGTFYFGGYDGFNVFHPKDFKDVKLIPDVPLIILDYEQHSDRSGKIEYRLEEILKSGEITLEPGDKLFNIRVALEDYRNAKDHRFAYKIEGFQEDWSEDKSNLIRISGLPYGDFVLKIKGRLHNGLYSQSELEIPVRVLKPFYLTTWFFILSLMSFFASVFAFNKWRNRNLREQKKLLEKSVSEATETISKQNLILQKDKETIERQAKELLKTDQLKSRFFANVSHELRTPLTLILGPLQSILRVKDPKEKDYELLSKMRSNGKKLNRLINQILDLSKLEVGKLSLNPKTEVLYLGTRKNPEFLRILC